MSVLTTSSVQGWLERTKLTVTEIDTDLETHFVNIVFSSLAHMYDTSGWTSTANTPPLVITIISMKYAARFYARAYSEGPGDSKYANRLDKDAEDLISSLSDGSIMLPSVEVENDSTPSFYPNDLSSVDDPASFSMGRIW